MLTQYDSLGGNPIAWSKVGTYGMYLHCHNIIYIHMYIIIHMHGHLYVCAYIHIYSCIYICMYMYVLTHKEVLTVR
jgi:hypothetical protein